MTSFAFEYVPDPELTDHELELFHLITFDPSHVGQHQHGENGRRAEELALSLIQREAIPAVRWRYFTEPDLGPDGRSWQEVVQLGASDGRPLFRSPGFLPFLRYFLFGPDLPPPAGPEFYEEVARGRVRRNFRGED